MLKASIILSFADPSDIQAVRRLLYNSQGVLQETLALVEMPKVLYAGFHWTLKQLQHQSLDESKLMVASKLASDQAFSAAPACPIYSTHENFSYKLDLLRKEGCATRKPSLTLEPMDFLSNGDRQHEIVDAICEESTLDPGQAEALCHSLCRDLAFTQGPPGTGKT